MAILDNYIRISEGELKQRDERRLLASLTFYPQEDVKVWTYRRRRSSGELWLPRGILSELPSYVSVRDKRSFPKLPKYDTNIVLDYQDENKKFAGQQECIDAMFENKQGLIHRQPGTGKTQIALYFVATVGTRTLVVVHTKDLLEQWVNYARKSIPDMPIGIIASGKEQVEQLTIATIQTLFRRNYKTDWWRQFGATIIDETHHVPAETFDQVIAHSTSRYRFGLSASKTRADHMEPLMHSNIGPVIHELKFNSPVPVRVVKVKTDFKAGKQGNMVGPIWLQRKRWHGMIKSLCADPARNAKIARAVGKRLDEGRSVLVLSRRIDHLQNIQAALAERGHDSEVLAAKLTPKNERREMVEAFKRGEIKCVLATQLADEGLDVPILSCVCLAFPGKHADLIMQQVGRALREYKGKETAVIIDIVDPLVKTLRSQWHKRRRAYLGWGFMLKRDKANVMPKRVRRMVYGRLR
jgi:superfamily II DNA or RNA helicase